MDSKERNQIVREVEIAYRNKVGYRNCRIRQINPEDVRTIMKENKIGMQCEKCLNKGNNGRYCCPSHRDYYLSITNQTYGQNYPFDYEDLEKEFHKNILNDNKDEHGDYIQPSVSCMSCGIKKSYSEMSSDHIRPISKGGLEFDRENLQWMCLTCNLKKHNHVEDGLKQTKLTAPIPPTDNDKYIKEDL